MALNHYLCFCIVYVASYHFQGGVAEYLLEPEDVTAFVDKEISSKGVSAEMGMHLGNIGFLRPPPQYQFYGIRLKMLAVEGEEEIINRVAGRLGTEMKDVAPEYFLSL